MPEKKTNTKHDDAIEIIAAELLAIANEIEELPSFDPGELTNEKMVQLQKIDFCSQRLREVSKLIVEFAEQSHQDQITLLKILASTANLEHTRDLFEQRQIG
ncbi:hypothetical protein [Ahrensia marina]|uniref:Uncharacterized protein n=1 Tax=Ahrensia marina TaxID=1514904 RepID=A0A0M9GLC0_9HYPH|nr:hypothetical protein [Ahrensia marina]KPB00116.1 hypothetical protein SU32_15515 [Ahrensia marina]